MIPDEEKKQNGRMKTVPTIIEVDGKRTIPSVVSFVPQSNSEHSEHLRNLASSLSLPPWSEQIMQESNLSGEDLDATWPNLLTKTEKRDPTNNYEDCEIAPYKILVGQQAVEAEKFFPRSSYRNVKRIIGTGGTMSQLALGVVPNLFIGSVHSTPTSSHGSTAIGDKSVEELSKVLGEDFSDDNVDSNKKNKGKGKKKTWKNKKKKKKKQLEIPKLHKQLEQADLDPAMLTFTPSCNDGAGTELRPEQISACILRKLYDTAEEFHRERSSVGEDGNLKQIKVTRAVIGVPAYFTEAQRQATIRASELAGVSKVKLLPEPEAAALAYGVNTGSAKQIDEYGMEMEDDDEESELILVFDLGGGTFDVSILDVGGGVSEVLATVGNNRLGGTDFDKRIAEYLCRCAVDYGKAMSMDEEMPKETGVKNDSDMYDPQPRSNKSKKPPVIRDWYQHGSGEVPDIILRVAETARKALSNQKVVEVLVPLSEEGWKKVGGGDGEADGDGDLVNVIGPFGDNCMSSIIDKLDMVEGFDYTIVSLDRKTFADICYNELQLLLQPIREVAIMAGVLLPGEARPSYLENALSMARSAREKDDGENFWDFDDFDNDEEDNFDAGSAVIIKTSKDGVGISDGSEQVENDDESIDDEVIQQLYEMDVRAKKKEQQRGRKTARDVAKRERKYRQQKQKATEEATNASLLGKKGDSTRRGGVSTPSLSSSSNLSSLGNERVQDGIHGRLLSRIVLVGGATRMPVIGKLLEAVVGMVPQRTVNPDEAVALGCAVQVGILDGDNEGLLGGMQAVLSPMQAAVMRALAKKRGLDMMGEGDEEKGLMMGGGSIGRISGFVIEEDDDLLDGFDEDDETEMFYLEDMNVER